MLTKSRLTRKRRNYDKARGTKEFPRLVVYRSNQHIYGQIIDDEIGKVLVNLSDKNLKGNKIEKAMALGKEIAQLATKSKISKVKFDRAGYRYHGRVKAVAEGAREGGLIL